MKRCPTCTRTYEDDTLSFCLQDGARLTPAYDPEATVISHVPPPVGTGREPQKSSNYLIYLLIVLLLALGGAGVGLYLAITKYNESTAATAVAESSPSPSLEPSASPLTAKKPGVKPSPAQNSSDTLGPTNQPAIPKIYGKAYGVARRQLIKEGWLPNKRLPYHGNEAETQSGNGPIFWQRGYWELESCSGTGSAFCLFEFTDPTGRLLEVVTEGEEDEGGTYHATVSRVYLKKK
jgi:hypothetical protein